MSNRVVRVQLDDHRIRKARELRAAEIEAVIKQIYDRFPDPTDLRPREYDVHERASARKATLRKLRSKRK